MVPATEMPVIIAVTVIMKSVVEMPVVRAPRVPVRRVITPVPRGVPTDITRVINISYKRPVCHHIDCYPCSSGVTRIRSPGVIVIVYWFNNIIPSIQSLIADKLYLNSSVTVLLNRKNSDILSFVPVHCDTQYYVVDITVNIVIHCYIINHIVSIQVKVIDL
jgi:hypothetical protein